MYNAYILSFNETKYYFLLVAVIFKVTDMNKKHLPKVLEEKTWGKFYY